MSLINRSRIPIKEMILVGLFPSFIKKWIYRMRGAKIGKGVHLSIGCVLIGDQIEIGDYTEIGFLAIIKGRDIKIGKRVSIGSTSVIDVERMEICNEAVITEQVFIGGNPTRHSYFKLGERAIVMYNSYLNCSQKLIIGNDSGIGGHCILFTHGTWQSVIDGYPAKYDDVIIGNNVWLPWRVFVMPGVTIGDNATIGAGSLVNKDIPQGVLAVGNPIKILKTAEEYPRKMDRLKKHELLADIIEDLCGELNYFEYKTAITKETDYWLIDVTKGRQAHQIVYSVSTNEFVDTFKFNKQSMLLSLGEVSTDLKESIVKSGSMLIDIPKRERSGNTEIGEEVILGLKKYGIRFIRTDA